MDRWRRQVLAGRDPALYRAWSLERSPLPAREETHEWQGLEWFYFCGAGISGSSRVHLAFAFSGLRVLSPAAPLHFSAGASLSLQGPTPPRPHWQSRFEACQPRACLLHKHGTRHVAAAPAHGWPLAHSSLAPCSLSKHPLVPVLCPGLCRVGPGAWSCLRLAHCPV